MVCALASTTPSAPYHGGIFRNDLSIMNDFILTRGTKASIFGAAFGIVLVSLVRWVFKLNIRMDDVVAGGMAGAVSTFVPAVCLPERVSLPRDITTVTLRAMSAVCWWVLANGIAKGWIHELPGRYRFTHPDGWLSWEREPVLFLMVAFQWIVGGSITIGIPIVYFRKAWRETSSNPDDESVRQVDVTWGQLSNTQVIAVRRWDLCFVGYSKKGTVSSRR